MIRRKHVNYVLYKFNSRKLVMQYNTTECGDVLMKKKVGSENLKNFV